MRVKIHVSVQTRVMRNLNALFKMGTVIDSEGFVHIFVCSN